MKFCLERDSQWEFGERSKNHFKRQNILYDIHKFFVFKIHSFVGDAIHYYDDRLFGDLVSIPFPMSVFFD